jgi:DNA-binding response OmpR family regulator
VKRLLVVDDEEHIRLGMRRYFQAAGFHVDCAAERDEAEALVANGCYDVAILDLALTPSHGPDGLHLIASLREWCPSTRILVLTAVGAAEVHEEATRLGADHFLLKPQPLDRVLAVLTELTAAAGKP